MTEKRKIYCFNNGGEPGWMHAIAIAEDGHCLAQHICSDEGFMRHDLGIASNWKHEYYNAHFGEGNWELEWVYSPESHAGLQTAFALNRQLADSQTPPARSEAFPAAKVSRSSRPGRGINVNL